MESSLFCRAKDGIRDAHEGLECRRVLFRSGPGGACEQGEGADYINCPFEKPNYLEFHAALLAAEKTEFKEWEKNTPYFEGCLPIEVMAERGPRTLTFGPMKPVGLTDPRTGRKPYAVVQLRIDRKSVVEGKSVSVRVDLGGGR